MQLKQWVQPGKESSAVLMAIMELYLTPVIKLLQVSNVIAGVIRDQYNHLYEHIAQKKAIYERYKEGLKNLPVQMNPFDETKAEPNYWLSSLLIDEDAMCKQVESKMSAQISSREVCVCRVIIR